MTHTGHRLDEPTPPRTPNAPDSSSRPNTNSAADPAPQHRRGASKLDRIPNAVPVPCASHIIDLRGRHPRRRQRRPHHRLLRRPRRHRLPTTGPVLIDRQTPHHRQHRIPVTQRIRQAPQHHHPQPSCAHTHPQPRQVLHNPSGANIPHCEHAMNPLGAQVQVHPGGDHPIAFPPPQTLHPQMNRHQRRRTRRVTTTAGPCTPRKYDSRPAAKWTRCRKRRTG